MLIFARPPSDPAPEFESGLNLGSNLAPRCASSRRLQPDCKQVSSRNFILQEEQGRLLAGQVFYYCRSQRLISPFTYRIKCGIKGS